MQSAGVMASVGRNHFIDHEEALPCQPSGLAKAALGLNLIFFISMIICLILYLWVAHYRKGRRCHICTGVRWCVCEEDDNNDVESALRCSDVRNTMIVSSGDLTDSVGAVHFSNKNKHKTLPKAHTAGVTGGGQIKDIKWDTD